MACRICQCLFLLYRDSESSPWSWGRLRSVSQYPIEQMWRDTNHHRTTHMSAKDQDKRWAKRGRRQARTWARWNAITYQFEDDTTFFLMADFYVEEDIASTYTLRPFQQRLEQVSAGYPLLVFSDPIPSWTPNEGNKTTEWVCSYQESSEFWSRNLSVWGILFWNINCGTVKTEVDWICAGAQPERTFQHFLWILWASCFQ